MESTRGHFPFLQLPIFKVPMIMSSSEASTSGVASTPPWIFKRGQGSGADLSILLTPMQGSKINEQSKQSKGKKAKAKAKQAGKRSKPVGADGEHASVDIKVDILPEPEQQLDNVAVEVAGVTASRQKFFLDCLLGGIRSALKSAVASIGLPVGSKPVEPPASLGRVGQDEIFYHDSDYPILRRCVGLGIDFAFDKKLMLSGKGIYRWSACRPQIQQVAINMAKAAPWHVIMFRLFMLRLFVSFCPGKHLTSTNAWCCWCCVVLLLRSFPALNLQAYLHANATPRQIIPTHAIICVNQSL